MVLLHGKVIQSVCVFDMDCHRGCTVKFLTSLAMAVFGVQWLLSAQLVLNLATMTAAVISSLEIGIIVVDFVWCTKLPFVVFAMKVALISIVSILAAVIIYFFLG